MNPEQIIERLLENWAAIGAGLGIVLVLIGRIRSGDWRGAARLAVRLYRVVRPAKPINPGKLRPPISWGDDDNGKKPNG